MWPLVLTSAGHHSSGEKNIWEKHIWTKPKPKPNQTGSCIRAQQESKWIQHHAVPGWSPTPVLSGLKPRSLRCSDENRWITVDMVDSANVGLGHRLVLFANLLLTHGDAFCKTSVGAFVCCNNLHVEQLISQKGGNVESAGGFEPPTC